MTTLDKAALDVRCAGIKYKLSKRIFKVCGNEKIDAMINCLVITKLDMKITANILLQLLQERGRCLNVLPLPYA